ncbi:MAG TPA: DUF1552 domain-containing protein [Vicinamibacterales bacterium]|nr:DUF1552 domain-containing protein [Vicinamibacterales bacterium]
MFISNKHLSRRAVLRGIGATMALPFLEAMIPARSALAAGAAAAGRKLRFVALEMVHGAAGSTQFGIQKHLWAPEAVGSDFDLTPSVLSPLEPFRSALTVVSNIDVRNAEAFTAPEIGGDHFRSSAVFLTQSHPKQTQGSDLHAGVSLDQIFAARYGQETPIPSMQLCIENVDQSGGCSYGYSCAYTDSISWASPSQPLPMIRDPRLVFDQLFGVGATPAERKERRAEDRSILDWLGTSVNRLKKDLGAADRARLDDYLEDVREIERRIQKVEAYNTSGEPRELPGAPIGVPDSFSEHVKLMFDLQALAFASDLTRVFAFKLGRDASNRVYAESGFKGAFHSASHHQEKDERILDFAKINKYHVSLVPYLLEKLKNTPDGDGTSVLDNSVIIYGSPMGDSNVHNHKRVPLFIAGHAGGALKGNMHVKAADGTPMANAMLTLANKLGLGMPSFGDSTGELDLNAASPVTTEKA